jgi:hypothetical protein
VACAGVASCVLATLGELSNVGAEEMRAFLPELLPLILDALQDQTSFLKQEVRAARVVCRVCLLSVQDGMLSDTSSLLLRRVRRPLCERWGCSCRTRATSSLRTCTTPSSSPFCCSC